MGWYQVVKTINGRKYLYLQMTYREGGKVKTKNKYLGRANGSSRSFAHGPAHIPTASEYPKVEKPAGGLKVDKIRRLKPLSRRAQAREKAHQPLREEIERNLSLIKELKKVGFTDEISAIREQNKYLRRSFKQIFDRSYASTRRKV